MSLYASLLLSLPVRLRAVNKIKPKTPFQSSAGCQFYSCLLSHRFFTTTSCFCSTTKLCDQKSIFPIQYESCFTNTSSRLVPVQFCYSYQNYLIKYYCSSSSDCSKAPEPEKKLSVFQRFKKMYKEYGYVLVPVHLVTSAFWFSSFYYLTKSGVDIASVLESIGVGEKLVEKLRNTNSTMGYIAISYALYKIATPLRYTVTLGGTTLSIKYLRDWGYIKPIPPKDKLKEIMHDQKDKLMEKKEKLKKRFPGRRFIKRAPLKIGLKKT